MKKFLKFIPLLVIGIIASIAMVGCGTTEKEASAKNRMIMLGRKVKIPPAPDTIPSTTNEINISLTEAASIPLRRDSDTHSSSKLI